MKEAFVVHCLLCMVLACHILWPSQSRVNYYTLPSVPPPLRGAAERERERDDGDDDDDDGKSVGETEISSYKNLQKYQIQHP